MEQNQTYDKLIDGLNAVRNAVLKGVLPGGGAALLHASKLLEFCHTETLDEQMGVKVMQRALQEPFRNILENAGISPGMHLEDLMNTNDWRFGVDVRQNKIIDMIAAGVS